MQTEQFLLSWSTEAYRSGPNRVSNMPGQTVQTAAEQGTLSLSQDPLGYKASQGGTSKQQNNTGLGLLKMTHLDTFHCNLLL